MPSPTTKRSRLVGSPSGWARMLALAVMLVAGPPQAQAGAETIVVYGSDQFPPVSYLAEGKAEGVFPAILARLEKETGDRYDIKLMPWARAYWMAEQGKGAVANISWNSEREKFLDFSVPIYPAEVVLVVKKGQEFPFTKLSDLHGKRIGAGLGSSYRDEVDQAIASGLIKVDRDPNQLSRLNKLLAGRVDAIFVGTGRPGVKAMVESAPQPQALEEQLVVLPRPVTVDPLYLAIPKSMNKKDALARLNAAYLKLRNSGQLDDLLPK
ncbi:transporter substrate-binding domain-containing protein [Aquincola sp. MAHUQ-54]|uniref:Transporter substrate-binding domain-containing protein n=1 Tax=Aquincola agrisoli TaxID=3119538 RepID=A0AAW9Q565_9BURK